MPARILSDLTEIVRQSERSVGQLGKQIAALDQKAIPVPTTLVIPQETLAGVIEESGILEELKRLSAHTDPEDSMARYQLREKIIHTLENLAFPEWFSSELLDSYHRYLHRGFVRFRSGLLDHRNEHLQIEHVQGDANVIQSLRHFWSQLVELALARGFSLKLSTLAPTAIILQAQMQAEASGIAYTLHPETGLRKQYFVQAIWGCPDTALFDTAADTYVLDNRSHNVILRTVGTQDRYYRRKQDGVETIHIPEEHQSKPVLPDKYCTQLSHILERIKRQNLHHVMVSWELTPSGFEITGYQPFHESTEQKQTSNHSLHTALFVSGGNPNKTRLDPLHQADGVGMLRSEYTYLSFGLHPLLAIKNRQRDALHQKLVSAIKSFKSSVNGKPVLMRSLFLSSAQLAQLPYGESVEPSEPNPFLGWRGGLRLTHQPQLLEFELSVIRSALDTTQSDVGYVIPFVRHPIELDSILRTITDQGLHQYAHFQSWWQLNTPENMLAVAAYPTRSLTGVIMHHHTIQAMLSGIDPTNSDVADRYSIDPEPFLHLMTHLVQEIQRTNALRTNAQPLKVLLYLEQFVPELVRRAVQLRCDGIIVKPAALAMAREYVAECEHTQLLHM